MLAGRFKIPKEEKLRQKELLSHLRIGIVLEFIKSDYHEDDRTPYGFMERGDVVTLNKVLDTRPIIEHGTGKQVDSYKVWEIESRYGTMIRDELYLAAMTKIKTDH